MTQALIPVQGPYMDLDSLTVEQVVATLHEQEKRLQDMGGIGLTLSHEFNGTFRLVGMRPELPAETRAREREEQAAKRRKREQENDPEYQEFIRLRNKFNDL